LQSLVAGRLLARVGPTPLLVVLPLVSGLGFGAAAWAPTLLPVATMFILRRAAAYGLVNPTYGVLFTVVSREEKYKARAFIDTVVYRGGDVVGGAAFSGVVALGVGLSGAALAAAALALPWLWLAVRLGRKHHELARPR
jgi:AAA family ATP:ADP antiporter